MCELNTVQELLNAIPNMSGSEQLSKVLCLFYLLLLSAQDIRSHTLSVRTLICGAVAAVVYQLLYREVAVWICVAGAIIGLIFIGVSKVTGEALGYGDSILMFILGVYLGIYDLLYLLLISFGLAAVFSTILLLKSHYNRKKSFPFIPFITVGYIILCVIQNM